MKMKKKNNKIENNMQSTTTDKPKNKIVNA